MLYAQSLPERVSKGWASCFIHLQTEDRWDMTNPLAGLDGANQWPKAKEEAVYPIRPKIQLWREKDNCNTNSHLEKER